MNTTITELPIIDWEHNAQFELGQTELKYELLRLFAVQLPELQTAIHEAFVQKNYVALDNRLHKLQGGSSYCGLRRLKAVILDFLDHLRTTHTASHEGLEKIDQELQTVMQELKNKGLV